MRANNRGFTAVELMIVLTISSVLLALYSPNLWAFYRHQRIQSGAIQLASAMRLAQSRSVAKCVRYEVRFDALRNEAVLSQVDHFLGVVDSLEVKRYTFEEPVHLGRANFGGHPVVTFFSNGSCTASGLVELCDGRETYKVNTLACTGKVTVTR